MPAWVAADVVQRQGGGDRLAVGEAAERVETGGAERFRQAAAGDQRRRRDRLRRTLVRPVAQGNGGGGEDLRRFQAAEQCGKFERQQDGGFEQAGRDVEPGGADALLVLRQGEQQVGAAGVEQSVLGDGAGGDEADDLAPDRALPVRVFGSSICSATATRKPRRIRRAR